MSEPVPESQEMIALRQMIGARDMIDHELGRMHSAADAGPCLPATRPGDTGRLLAEPAEVITRAFTTCRSMYCTSSHRRTVCYSC